MVKHYHKHVHYHRKYKPQPAGSPITWDEYFEGLAVAFLLFFILGMWQFKIAWILLGIGVVVSLVCCGRDLAEDFDHIMQDRRDRKNRDFKDKKR